MSHVTEMGVDVNPKFINEFVESLKEHFGEDGVEVNLESPIQMKRYNGESLHRESHLGSCPPCHIVVRKATQEKAEGRSMAVNDLGYLIKDDKVQGFVDIAGFTKDKQDLVVMDYAARVSAKQLKKQGYMVKVVKENNTVKLKASKYM